MVFERSGGVRRWALAGWAFLAALASACTGLIGDGRSERETGVDADGTGDRGGTTESPDVPLVSTDPIEPASAEFAPVTRAVRRLTRDEYLYTLEDVLGVRLDDGLASLLPVDRPLAGFVNVASGQTVLPEHIRAYSALAAEVSAQIDLSRVHSTRDTPCREEDGPCVDAFVASAGKLLFRRPMTEREQAAFVALYETVASAGVGSDESARAVLAAMLQSPSFLYLLEVERWQDETPLRRIGGYEMASRLSYFLWSSAPDSTLYEAAETGLLDTEEGIREEVSRMLADRDKVARALRRFILDWSRVESIADDDGRKDDLILAAVGFYRGHLEAGGSLFGIFSRKTAYLTGPLAEAYGVAPRGDGFLEYDLSAYPGRGGLLTQPGILAGMTNADGSAIVARGLFLQRQLFCGETPDPPSSLQEEIEAFSAEQPEDASDRAVADMRMTRTECAACHQQFDPLAFGFEQFDFRGRYRTEDEHGNTLRTDGWLPGVLTREEEVPYDGIDDYMTKLEGLEVVRRCFVQRQVEYAMGALLEREHRGSVSKIADALLASGGTHAELAALVASHDLFRSMPKSEEGP